MSSCEYQKIWSAFDRKIGDRELKFEVENIPEAFWSTTVEFMLGNYIREDVWWATAGTAKEPDAVQEYRMLLMSIVQHKMSIACFLTEKDGSGRSLVAVNMCMPQKKGVFIDHRPPKSKAGLLSLRMFAEAMKVTAIYEKFEVNEYMMGTGLSVALEYRGLGISVELLKARMQLAKTLGYKVTGGIFTSAAAQRVADKVGMECCYQIPYEDFGKRCGIKFHTKTDNLKVYACRID